MLALFGCRKNAANVLLFAIGAFLALGVFSQIMTGYANNGDFARSVRFVFERPLGFHSLYVPADNPEFQKLFFSQWHDLWSIREKWLRPDRQFSYSAYKLYLLIQVGWGELIIGGVGVYSVMLGSILSRALIFVFWIEQVRAFKRFSPPWLLAFAAMLLALPLAESSWIAFLNSFYEEQMMFIFLPCLACLMLRASSDHPAARTFVFALMLCSLIIGASKTSYFYVPTVVAFFCCFACPHRKHKLFVMWVLFQGLALLPVACGTYKKTNAYHSLYFGALTVLTPEELTAFSALGDKRIVRECVGVAAFFSGGEKCVERANAAYRDVLLLSLHNPAVLPRMLKRAMDAGREVDLEYLGRDVAESSHPPLPRWGGLKIFQYLYKHNFHWFVGIVTIMASVVLVLGRRTRGWLGSRDTLSVGLALAVIGWIQYPVALGDGFYELQKHVVMGGFVLAVASAYMLFGLVVCWFGGGPHDGSVAAPFVGDCRTDVVVSARP